MKNEGVLGEIRSEVMVGEISRATALAGLAATSAVGVRDDAGKPDTSLIPPELLLRFLPEPMHAFVRWFHCIPVDPDNGQVQDIDSALWNALAGAGNGDIGVGLINLAAVSTMGAKKYARHNWEKGLAYSRLFRSGVNHALKSLSQQNDEESGLPHLWHYAWNVHAAWTMVERGRTDLDDREQMRFKAP